MTETPYRCPRCGDIMLLASRVPPAIWCLRYTCPAWGTKITERPTP
jgi:predicted RNA-binding Zn-ribbon protein involved in translation (DUF1610 family)